MSSVTFVSLVPVHVTHTSGRTDGEVMELTRQPRALPPPMLQAQQLPTSINLHAPSLLASTMIASNERWAHGPQRNKHHRATNRHKWILIQKQPLATHRNTGSPLFLYHPETTKRNPIASLLRTNPLVTTSWPKQSIFSRVEKSYRALKDQDSLSIKGSE